MTVLGEFLAFKHLGENGWGDPDVSSHKIKQQIFLPSHHCRVTEPRDVKGDILQFPSQLPS